MKWTSHRDTYIPSFLSLPPPQPRPTPLDTEHQAELPVLYSYFPLALSFIPGSVHMSVLLSQFEMNLLGPQRSQGLDQY